MNEDETIFTVKLTPKASRNHIQGWVMDEKGDRLLKASVTVVPEKGKANKALIALLSKKLKHPKSSFSIISGETSRLKIIKVEGLNPKKLDF